MDFIIIITLTTICGRHKYLLSNTELQLAKTQLLTCTCVLSWGGTGWNLTQGPILLTENADGVPHICTSQYCWPVSSFLVLPSEVNSAVLNNPQISKPLYGLSSFQFDVDLDIICYLEALDCWCTPQQSVWWPVTWRLECSQAPQLSLYRLAGAKGERRYSSYSFLTSAPPVPTG
jgi:hypothetical protein